MRGAIAPLVGRVSMDSITIDRTDLTDVSVGDTVVLWEDEPIVATIAQLAGTASCELLTRLGHRGTRAYVGWNHRAGRSV